MLLGALTISYSAGCVIDLIPHNVRPTEPRRQLTSGFGKACCNALQLRPGTWPSRYTQLYIGFAVSGLIHCGGDLMVDRALFGASFAFYVAQALAITLEDAIIGLYGRSGVGLPQPLLRLVGYVWALSWLCVSAPWQIGWMLERGLTGSDLARSQSVSAERE